MSNPMNTYAVEGAIGTRKSARAYTHAVVVEQTVASYAAGQLPKDIKYAVARAADHWDYSAKCAAGKLTHTPSWEKYIGAEGVLKFNEECRVKGVEFLAQHPDRAAHIAAAEQDARERAAKIVEGTFIVSWHHSAALAVKALATAPHRFGNVGSFRVAPCYIAKTHTPRKAKAVESDEPVPPQSNWTDHKGNSI